MLLISLGSGNGLLTGGTKPLPELVLTNYQYDGLVQERRNSSVLAMELRLSCTNPSNKILRNSSQHIFCFNALEIIHKILFENSVLKITITFPVVPELKWISQIYWI